MDSKGGPEWKVSFLVHSLQDRDIDSYFPRQAKLRNRYSALPRFAYCTCAYLMGLLMNILNQIEPKM